MSHRLSKSAKGDWYTLVGPYDADLVARIRSEVPATHREWRPVAKCWRIWPPYHEAVQSAICDSEDAEAERCEDWGPEP